MQREVRLGVNFSSGHQCLYYGHHSFEEQKNLFLGPVHTYPDIFESATFSFRIQKFPTSTRVRIQIEFARPHVSDAYPGSLEFQDSSGNIGNRACVEVAILNTVFAVKDWAQSCDITG